MTDVWLQKVNYFVTFEDCCGGQVRQMTLLLLIRSDFTATLLSIQLGSRLLINITLNRRNTLILQLLIVA